MYTLDTNVIIYFLGGDEAAQKVLIEESRDMTLFVSTITETELFSYPALSGMDEHNIGEFLRKTILILIDSRIARFAAFLRRSGRLPLGDSLVAATAILTQTILLTRNMRDFRKIPELRVRAV